MDDQEMELLYVWINQDETGYIRKQGFNFSPNYHFEMTIDADENHLLTCTENPDYYNVWKTEETNNTVSLCAIVGKNGSGKSSLLRHLINASMLPDLNEDNPDKANWHEDMLEYSKMVQVFRCDKSIKILHNLEPDKFDYPKHDKKYIAIHISGTDFREANRVLSSQTRIYMSNAISSDNSLRWKQNPIIFTPTINNDRARGFDEKIRGIDVMLGRKWQNGRGPIDENLRHFMRLQSKTNGSKSMDFEKLATLSYYHSLSSEATSDIHLPITNTHILVGIEDCFRKLSLKVDRAYKEGTLASNEYVAYIKQLVTCYDESKSLEVPMGQRNRRVFQNPLDALEHCLKYEEEYLSHFYGSNLATCEVELIAQYHKRAHNELKDLRDIWDAHTMSDLVMSMHQLDASPRLKLICGSKEYIDFCKYIDGLMKNGMSFVLKYLIIEIPPMSSGEQALQNVFSWLRMPPYFRELFGMKSVPIQNNILLLLDEVDLYMHPEWQRQFPWLLLTRLNQEYRDKHIQVIISTHSPLVLSDIPSGNILYLEQENEHCTVTRGLERQETFGANIFSLLKDSFFLKMSVGQFAYERISRMIQDLNDLKATREDPNRTDDLRLEQRCREYRYMIDIIGEPVVKRRLRMLYADLFEDEVDDTGRRDLEKLGRLLESGDPDERRKYQALLKKILSDAASD